VIVNTGALHSISTITPYCNYDCLIVDKLFLESSDLPVDEMRLLSPLNDDTIRTHFDRITRELSERKPYYKIAVKAEVLALFAHVFRTASQRHLPGEEQGSRRLDMVRSAISYIRQHYKEDLTMDDICRHVGFSKYYFCREFRQITGKTVTDTINFFRCSHAKSLLSSGHCNVSESAERSGFHNLSYFSKVYKRHMGVLPSETERQD
jgi:AraC-like DNA-binding protein